MFSLALNFAKSLISSGSALLSFKSLAIFLKCYLVIIYQRVCLYKGFSTPVEKLAPGWAQHGRAGDASLRLTLGRSLSARPFAIPCQASPIVLDAGQFIRLTHTTALSVGGTYSYGHLLTLFEDSRNIISFGWGAILFCYFHLPHPLEVSICLS